MLLNFPLQSFDQSHIPRAVRTELEGLRLILLNLDDSIDASFLGNTARLARN